MIEKNPSVDGYIRKNKAWQPELSKLREIALDSGLTEEIKWRHPCYTLEGKNILIIQEFKDYCALMFFKGVLMDDPEGILIRQSENVQAERQLRFSAIEEITELEPVVKDYIKHAIEIEKSGRVIEYKSTSDYEVPEEFQIQLDEDQALKDAFEALTPGRQRGYLLHFGGAKQSKTRSARVERQIPRILEGLGLHD